MSADIINFVNQLLETAPGAPHSVQLVIDTDGDEQALFEVQLMIMTDILKKWYQPPIKISIITPQDLEKLVAYFASFGIGFQLSVEPTPAVLRINNREYLQQSQLADMKFQMTDAGMLYTVRFSHL
jgi:hypothetical protein